ncbi:hypothetical protein ACIGZJ_30760 [Kitasatospora sp. NPDC052868]|uniref:hypothetical protein n=1 Tax=Kitasatospora sp. NPDC052868 TaxID=3364060 RepID=UPI0037C8063B
MDDATVCRLVTAGALAVVAAMAAATVAFCLLCRAWRALARGDAACRTALDAWAREELLLLEQKALGIDPAPDPAPPARYAPLLPEERYAHFQVVREACAVVEDLLPLVGPLYLHGERLMAADDR